MQIDLSKLDLSKYKEIRGTVAQKKHSLFGKYYLFISDGNQTVPIVVGKAAYLAFSLDAPLTVGYIGQTAVNLRPGMVAGEE